jgi:hypothetical protein
MKEKRVDPQKEVFGSFSTSLPILHYPVFLSTLILRNCKNKGRPSNPMKEKRGNKVWHDDI